MNAENFAERVARLEERLAWFERHVAEQDKAMLELAELVDRMRRELLALRARGLGDGAGGTAGDAGASDERPPHY